MFYSIFFKLQPPRIINNIYSIYSERKDEKFNSVFKNV